MRSVIMIIFYGFFTSFLTCLEARDKLDSHYFAIKLINDYQKHISPLFGNNCRFNPSCSQYAKDSIIKYNNAWGILMASDRLQRCNPYGEVGFDPPEKHFFLSEYNVSQFPEHISYGFNQDNDLYSKLITSDTAYSQYLFAEYLFRLGEYKDALQEYERFIFYSKSKTNINIARIKIAKCYMKTCEYDKAIAVIKNFIDFDINEEIYFNAKYLLSNCYMKNMEYAKARDQLTEIINIYSGTRYASKSYFMLAWSFIEEHNWANAIETLSKLSSVGDDDYNSSAKNLITDCQNAPKEIKKKSILIGSILSIFPGGGKIYSGKIKDGLFSLFTNGLLFYLAFDNLKRENYFTGTIFTMSFTGLYTGNIYGGIDSVKNYNRDMENDYVETMRIKYLYYLDNN